MAYTAPLGEAIDFDLAGTYYAINGGRLWFHVGDTGRVCIVNSTPDGSAVDFNLQQLSAAASLDFKLQPICYPAYEGGEITEPKPDLGATMNPNFSSGIRLPYTSPSQKHRQTKVVSVDTPIKDRSLNIARGQFEHDRVKQTASTWNELPFLTEQTTAAWDGGITVKDAVVGAGWQALTEINYFINLSYRGSLQVTDQDVLTPWLAPPPVDDTAVSSWGTPHAVEYVFNAPWENPQAADEHLMTQWGDQVYQKICLRDWVAPSGDAIEFNLLDSEHQGYLGSHVPIVFDPYTHDLRCSQQLPGGWIDVYPTYPLPTTYPGAEIPIQQVYTIMHTASITILSGEPLKETALEFESLTLNYDADAWAWRFNGSIRDEESLALIRPDHNGQKIIRVELDGYVWRFLVESYSSNHSFASSSWSVSGRSLTAELAAPYRLPVAFTQSSQLNAVQLAEQEVTGLDWTVNWNTVDWPVHAEAYSYNGKTPIQALTMIAGAVGARIVPHRSEKSISVESRYPISPWEWSDTETMPDLSLTLDMVRGMSSRWEPKPEANGIYVRGQNVGVNCFVKRANTDGGKQKTEVVDQLITDTDAGLERGRVELSDTGYQELITLDLPLTPESQQPGLLEPGALLQVEEGENNIWRGLVVSVSITANQSNSAGLSIDQKITLERHHGHN